MTGSGTNTLRKTFRLLNLLVSVQIFDCASSNCL